MSSFRLGTVPSDFPVERPHWPRFDQGVAVEEVSARQTAGVVPGLAAGIPPAGLASPAAQVEEILNEARLEASRILQEAAAEVEAALEAARQEGFAAGEQEGFSSHQAELELRRAQVELELERAQAHAGALRQTAEAEAKVIRSEAEARAQGIINQALERSESIRSEALTEQQHRLEEAQAALVELAVTAAIRLVQGHLALQPASVINMVAAGLRRLRETNCTVRVSPEDLPLIEAQRSTLERELGAGLLQVQPDPGLSPGSYMIGSPQGHIDARLQQQASHLKAAMKAALGGNDP